MAIIKPHDIVEIKKGVSIDTLFFPNGHFSDGNDKKRFLKLSIQFKP